MEQSPQRKPVTLFVEGLGGSEPGPGGWGCILMFGEHKRELTDHMAGTTAARMELFALISGIGALKQPCDVTIYSTSATLAANFAGQEAPADPGLWKILKLQCKAKHRLRFVKVEDIKQSPNTMRCREMAEAAIGEYKRINPETTKSE